MSQKLARDMLKTLPRFAEGGAAYSPEAIRSYIDNLQAQPGGASDAQVRAELDRFGVTPTQFAQAYNVPVAGIQARYDAAAPVTYSPEAIRSYIDNLQAQPGGASDVQVRAELDRFGVTPTQFAQAYNVPVTDIQARYDAAGRPAPPSNQAQREQEERAAREAQERAARETQERVAREAQERVAREAQERAIREAQERAIRETQERTRIIPPESVFSRPAPGNVTPPISPDTFSSGYTPDLFKGLVSSYRPPAPTSPVPGTSGPASPVFGTPAPGTPAPGTPAPAPPVYGAPVFTPSTYGAFDVNKFIQDPNTFLGTYDRNLFTPGKRPGSFFAQGGEVSKNMLKTLPKYAEGGAATSEITKLYQDILGRAPEAEGLQYWINEFGADGVIDDRERAIFNQAAQPERLYNSAKTEVTKLYQDVLGRDPEEQGLQYWIKDFGADGVIDDRERAIFNQAAQPERLYNSAKTEVTKLYQDVLGRDPEEQGLQYWIKDFGADGIIDARERAIFNQAAQPELALNREAQRLEAQRLEAQRLEAQRLERLEAQRREMERLAQERMEREKILPSPLPGTGSPYPQIPPPAGSSPPVISPPPVYPINLTPTPGAAPERPIAALPSTFSGTYNPNLLNEVVARSYNPPAPVGPIYGAFDVNRFIQDPNTFLGTYDFDFFNRLRRPPAPLPAEQPSALLAKGGEVSTNNFLRKRGKMK